MSEQDGGALEAGPIDGDPLDGGEAPVWEAYARRADAGVDTLPYVDVTHETTAVGMATGYATVTGRPQVVLLHAAAGLLQGANAIHGALLTGAPLVVCSGESTGYGD